jgi:uncharacterized tellurite resistance protein B-like protein
MINFLKKILIPKWEEDAPHNMEEIKNHDKKLQVATCALFIEMANADEDFTDEERNKIISIMQKTFELEKEYVEELIELSEKKIKESISIYEFTSIINEQFTKEEKFDLLKNLWRLIYLDGTLDKYEDNLVKRIGHTLMVDHGTIMGAKLLVKEEFGKKS